VIFPLFDHRGNVIGFAGRVLPGEERDDVGKYINSPDTFVYHKSKVLYGLNLSIGDIKEKKEAVIVEGELDLISSWQVGVKNVVAIKGSALTPEQIGLLNRFTSKIILALDADIAGDMAVRRGITTAYDKGLEIKVAKLTGYKDPDEAARKNPEGLKNAIAKAEGIWDFFVNSVFNKYKAASGEGSEKISKEIVPILSSISDKIVQAHYIAVVAQRLGVPTQAVEEQVGKTQASLGKGHEEEKTKDTPQEEKSRRQLLEERFLSLAFQNDPKILLDKESKDLFSIYLTKRIFEEFVNFSKSGKEFSTSVFSQVLPKELFSAFSEMILDETGYLKEDVDKLKKELALIKKEIAILDTKEKLSLLASKMGKLEQGDEKEELKKSQQEFSLLSEKLSELEES
jgi:DNA primase